MEAIILSITPYKEKDAIVNALNENEVFSFNVKGLLSSSSKNVAINNPLTIADLEFTESKTGHKILKSGDVKFTPMELMGKAVEMTLIIIISELESKCLENDEKVTIYLDLLDLLKNIKKSKNIFASTLYYVFKILRVSGYDFDVNGCHNCGAKKDIVGFSFEDGGYVCRNCMSSLDKFDLNGDQLLLIRKIYRLNKIQDIDFEISKEDFLAIFKKALIFIEDSYGLKIKNTELLFD